jgi:hypothetical protein
MKGAKCMNPTLIEYLGFVVIALILGWAIVEINRRYFSRRRVDSTPLNTWVTMDSTVEDDIEKPLPDEESVADGNIQIRAQHNGYHSESKKLL